MTRVAARARAGGRRARRGRQGDDVRRLHLPVVDRDARGVPGSRAGADRDPPGDGPRQPRIRATRTSACGRATSRRCGCTATSGSPRWACRRTCCSHDALGARLTWQVPDPASFAPALAARLGDDGTGRRRARAGRLDDRPRVGACSRSGRGSASRPRTIRSPAGRLRAGARRQRRADARGGGGDRRRDRRHDAPAAARRPRLGDRRARPRRRRARHVAGPRHPTRRRRTPTTRCSGRGRGCATRAGCPGAWTAPPRAVDRGPRWPRRSPATARVPRRSTCGPQRACVPGRPPPAPAA